MNPKLSILIPAYNTQDYISECLESILNQTYTDYEIIIVDDGSTDKTGQIIDEYSKIDNRIRVIHLKENTGTCNGARNVGIDEARGDYITFIDSDDKYLYNYSLKFFMDLIDKYHPDIIKGSVIKSTWNNFSTNKKLIEIFEETKEQSLFDLLKQQKIWAGLVNSITTREIALQSKLKYNICFEDLYINGKQLLLAKKIILCNEPTYWYRVNRPGSIVSTPDKYPRIDSKHAMYILWLEVRKKYGSKYDNMFKGYIGRLYIKNHNYKILNLPNII